MQVRQSYILPESIAGVIARESAPSPLIMLFNGKDRAENNGSQWHTNLGTTKLKEQAGLSCRLGFVEDRKDLSILHATKDAEVDANRFAAELLMPAAALEIWCRGGTYFKTVQYLLDVSSQVLRERYTSLELPTQ